MMCSNSLRKRIIIITKTYGFCNKITVATYFVSFVLAVVGPMTNDEDAEKGMERVKAGSTGIHTPILMR